jgi:hypothetical protein
MGLILLGLMFLGTGMILLGFEIEQPYKVLFTCSGTGQLIEFITQLTLISWSLLLNLISEQPYQVFYL